MPYAVLSDINALTGLFLTVSPSTTPSQAQTEAWINEFGAMLDSALTEGGYGTIPMTNASDLLVARKMVAEATTLKVVTVYYNWQVPEALATALGGIGAFEAWLEKIRAGKAAFVGQQGAADVATVVLSEELGASEYGGRYWYWEN